MTTLPTTQTDAPPATQPSRWRAWFAARTRTDWFFYGVSGLVVVLVFALQAPNIGFYGPNHGWTSSHGLAIMRHATPANGFVGHAMQFRGDDGSVAYDYFDRYPFFFSAGVGALLSLTDSLPVQVQLARYVMTAVYVATLGVAGLLAHVLLGDRWRALAAVMLAFSGWWLVFYKDMVHYDQPALFGNFLLLYALARYKLDGVRWGVYAAALIAVGLGRGYASYMILGLWLLWEVGAAVAQSSSMGVGARFISPLRSVSVMTSTRVFVIAIVWGAAFLGYNLVVESARRGVPLAQTSIVDSAIRRLPVFGEKEAGRTVGKDVLPWGEFAVVESERLIRWTLPPRVDNLNAFGWLFGAVMLITVLMYAWRQRGARRGLVLMTAFWGVAWLAFMINLAHGHEYVVMYGIGLPLVFYIAVASLLPGNRLLTGVLLLTAFVALGVSHASVRAELSNRVTNRAVFTEDYNRIAQRIEGTGRNVHINVSDGRCVIDDDFCYVLGFYLSEHFIAPVSVADYALSRLPTHYAHPVYLPPDDTNGLLLAPNTLTPENTTAHLFHLGSAERRTVPADAATRVTFGDSLTLQHWSLMGSVDVAPCGSARVESWWLAEDTLPDNYSMQLALVDSAGAGVAAANYDLSLLPTGVWVPGMYHIDSRAVRVPCDLPPGEYPLVMSVYAPGAGESLAVFSSDAQPMGDFYYLTTLFVNEN